MRKEVSLNLEDRGRKLSFKIREMPATKLESWIMKAVLLFASTADGKAVADGGIDGVIRNLSENGLAALANLDFDRAKPLLDELLECCARVEGKAEFPVSVDDADAYIEDVRTLFQLRVEALKVNLSFFGKESPSSSPETGNTVRLKRKSEE